MIQFTPVTEPNKGLLRQSRNDYLLRDVAGWCLIGGVRRPHKDIRFPLGQLVGISGRMTLKTHILLFPLPPAALTA